MKTAKDFAEQEYLSRDGEVVAFMDTFMKGGSLATKHPEGYVVHRRTRTGAWVSTGIHKEVEWLHANAKKSKSTHQ